MRIEKHPKVVSGALRDGFRARDVFGSFEKRTPGVLKQDLRTTEELTADRLAQLVEQRTAVREVAGSNLGRTNTQGL